MIPINDLGCSFVFDFYLSSYRGQTGYLLFQFYTSYSFDMRAQTLALKLELKMYEKWCLKIG